MKKAIKLMMLRMKNRNKRVCFSKNVNINLSSEFGGCNRIGKNTTFSGKLGYASYIGDNCVISADIGKYCCIASRVVTVRGTHPTREWVSMHPAFYSTAKQCGMTYVSEDKFDEKKECIKVGNDVWIGDSALILDGVSIGDGAVVAAGAVVTKDVEPYAIVAGVPAKVIRYRFDEEQRKKLIDSAWWDRGEEEIRSFSNAFNNIDCFLKKSNGERTE